MGNTQCCSCQQQTQNDEIQSNSLKRKSKSKDISPQNSIGKIVIKDEKEVEADNDSEDSTRGKKPQLQYAITLLDDEEKERRLFESNIKEQPVINHNQEKPSESNVDKKSKTFKLYTTVDLQKYLNMTKSLENEMQGCECLHINVDYKWDETSLEKIFELIVPSLTRVQISFQECKTLPQKVGQLLKNRLIRCEDLKEFTLQLGECLNLDDDTIENIKLALKNNQLKLLKLELGNQKNITGKSFQYIKEILEQNKKISSLILQIQKIDIDDNGIENIIQGIKQLESLKYYFLELWECKRITDDGVKKIGESLKQLGNLSYLSLSFFGCAQLQDISLQSLNEGFKNLKKLQQLTLNFLYINGINPDTVMQIGHIFEDHDNLEKTTFHFNGELQDTIREVKYLIG